MTNIQIIETEKAIRGIEEECHTFAVWKKLGYSVKKGEHAIFKTSLWKCKCKATEDGEQEEKRMFMTSASLFARSQVENLKEVIEWHENNDTSFKVSDQVIMKRKIATYKEELEQLEKA